MSFTFASRAARVVLAALCLMTCAHPPATPPQPFVAPGVLASPPSLSSLHENDHVLGFTAKALYVDTDGRPRGARLVHDKTGFVLDDLVIETAPQAMLYAWTYPESDAGEAHTQEHLLLGKGNAGRWLGNVLHATFTEQSAATGDRITAYHFNTQAGIGTFWKVTRTHLEALLHPDYSDEEILREVRNFGVSKRADGKLALEEKGTVYNEMVRTTEGSWRASWRAMLQLLYGPDHPLAFDPGGQPEGIRELTPARIRAFHAAHYQLGNMGGVVAFPSSVSLGDALGNVGSILDALATPDSRTRPRLTEATLPPMRPSAVGAMRVVEYPHTSAEDASAALIAWPANRQLELAERTTLETFMAAFAGGRGSNLYRALVDRTTRKVDVGATNVWAWTRNEGGEPTYIGLESVASSHANEMSLKAVRDVVRAELDAVAALPDGSKALAAFNDRVKAQIADRRRQQDKLLDTPPQFGARRTGMTWVEIFDDLAHTGDFVKDLSYERGYARAEALASSTTNEWRARIRTWGFLETPYAVASKASPDLRERLDRAREERTAGELARLEKLYATADPEVALAKRLTEVDAASARIAAAEKDVPLAPLAPDPPMVDDELLRWTSEMKDGVPHVASTFETMKSATVGIDLRLDTMPDESLAWLSVLPALMSDVGVVRDGASIAYDEVADRLRREVLGVHVSVSTDTHTKRAELAIEASGNDEDETKRALAWARDFLATPDWRKQNLPRIRDVVERQLSELRDVRNGPEEEWVEDVEESYRRQDQPLLLHAGGVFTRAHDAFVVSWRLEGGDDAKGVAPFLVSLATAGSKLDRTKLRALADALASESDQAKASPTLARWVMSARILSPTSRERARKAGRDLGHFLADIPDASLAADWSSLCLEMARGVARSPEEALDAIAKALASIRHTANARVWLVGSTKHQRAIADDLAKTMGALDSSPALPPVRRAYSSVLERARARGVAGDATFVSLVNPSTANGSLVHSAPSAGLDERRDDALVAYLAREVFDGEGTQSFYKRIWGAALAYSGYLSTSVSRERVTLYSDRCADLAQLLRFVEGEVRQAPMDAAFVDYTVARAFRSYGAATFEDRARILATSLVEGRTPERTRAFRAYLLAFRTRPNLAAAMKAQYARAMSPLIPSLAEGAPLPPDAVYFVIGPERAIASYEDEIRRARGHQASVLRLWARDFWEIDYAR